MLAGKQFPADETALTSTRLAGAAGSPFHLRQLLNPTSDKTALKTAFRTADGL